MESDEKLYLLMKPKPISRKRMTQEVVGQRYDTEKNQLPYGGAVDINGNIVWAVTKEEALATRERIKKAFHKK
jgi:hypothetical protein